MLNAGSLPPTSIKCLQFRHDCQHLGCSNLSCPQCALCQRRRCVGNFAPKYLAPCDVLEAKCGAQIYVVIVDTVTNALVQSGLDDAFLRLSLVDGRKLAAEGEWEEALDCCQLLLNKAGQPLLAHGRSGAYNEENAVVVPLIAGQAMLPDLKVTDSSEALLTGRAPPFRLLARVVQRGGIPFPGVAPVLSEPFVVATARVKGAAKAEIPHINDHVGKLEGLGVQTQKKLEDIAAAAAAAGITNLQVPINSVLKVGQFKELVEIAERSKSLRETLKQVLRLTKGWDIARDHARRAVHTDVQLRVYHPDGRTDVGLVYKCGAFNVVDINQPVGLLRRRKAEQRFDQELVDVIWLETDMNGWPDAVRRIVPRAATAWWHEGHPGWAFLPLQVSHIPQYGTDGKPNTSMSSYSFTMKPSPPTSGAGLGLPPVGMTGPIAGGNPNAFAPNPHGMVPQDMNYLGAGSSAATTFVPSAAGFFPSGIAPEYLATIGLGNGAGMVPSAANNGIGAPIVPPSFNGTAGNASAATDSLPNLSIKNTVDDSLSPFEDPAFQQLMSLVAANNPDNSTGNNGMAPSGDRDQAPLSGGSDGGGKGKRKADASLDTWMALNKSFDLDLDLPLGIGSLPGSGSGGSGAGPRTIVGSLLPIVGVNSLDPPSTGVPPPSNTRGTAPSALDHLTVTDNTSARNAVTTRVGNDHNNNNNHNEDNITNNNKNNVIGGGGSSAPFSEFLATVQQQRAHQRSQKLDNRVGDLFMPPPAKQRATTPPTPAAVGVPDDAPAVMPPSVTMGQLRDMFAKAVRQEISFGAVENFLVQNGLLSASNDWAQPTTNISNTTSNHRHHHHRIEQQQQQQQQQDQAMEGTEIGGVMNINMTYTIDPTSMIGFIHGLDHSGLEDMRSMEDDLPKI